MGPRPVGPGSGCTEDAWNDCLQVVAWQDHPPRHVAHEARELAQAAAWLRGHDQTWHEGDPGVWCAYVRALASLERDRAARLAVHRGGAAPPGVCVLALGSRPCRTWACEGRWIPCGLRVRKPRWWTSAPGLGKRGMCTRRMKTWRSLLETTKVLVSTILRLVDHPAAH